MQFFPLHLLSLSLSPWLCTLYRFALRTVPSLLRFTVVWQSCQETCQRQCLLFIVNCLPCEKAVMTAFLHFWKNRQLPYDVAPLRTTVRYQNCLTSRGLSNLAKKHKNELLWLAQVSTMCAVAMKPWLIVWRPSSFCNKHTLDTAHVHYSSMVQINCKLHPQNEGKLCGCEE